MEILQEELKIKELDKDIENINEKIKYLDKNSKEEFENKKNTEKELIEKEYQIKLKKYKNEKELEKMRKESELLEKKEKFKADKQVELAYLKEQAELVNQIISIMAEFNM